MKILAFSLALVFACGSARLFAACDSSGDVISSFESVASSCNASDNIGLWNISAGTASLVVVTAVAGTNQAVDGNDYASLNWSLVSSANDQIIATLSSPFLGAGTNWSSANYFSVAYGETNTATSGANSYVTSLDVVTASNGTVQFEVPGSNLTNSAATLTSGQWIYDIVSMSYAENLGMSFANVSSISIEEDGNAIGFGNTSLALDYLSLAGNAHPQPPITPANLTSTPSCAPTSQLTITWSAPAPVVGDDPIFGYHVYRALTVTGPWSSVAYVSSPSYTESSSVNATEYFVVLPYSISTTAFGSGNTGEYAGCALTSLDPVWLPVDGGVNEALITAATPKAFFPYGGCPPSPTSTQSPSPSSSPTRTPSVTVSSTVTPSPTLSPTLTASPTPPPPGSTLTDTPTVSPVQSPTDTPIIPNSPTNTPVVPVFTPTITPTFTNSPVPPPYNDTEVYPNPFYPDSSSSLFHVGNVKSGQEMTIYDMIGRLVYSKALVGNPQVDTWDGSNNNGVTVGTGIYILVITGDGQQNQIYRVAVVRAGK